MQTQQHRWTCYRSFHTPTALSFDLDDTLYDNVPVITGAEKGTWAYLQSEVPEWAQYSRDDWWKRRHALVDVYPFLKHDVSRLRRWAIREMALALGLSKRQARQLSRDAFAHFLELRNQVEVAEETHQLLAGLAERYPLAAISNGNVSLEAIGLADYFDVALFAGDGWPMKPVHCLFREAERRLKLAPHQLLHIGDNLHTDVHGANMAGWQSGWLNVHKQPLKLASDIHTLPTIEFEDVAALHRLL
ncbi:HAD-IA family hydrolase [Corallincola platygyrae]|uniref:HAD-IA family hydrolase n=1 Tax=Corallincola platygyrae TaxID=1193278 RepID=A0ABW4XKK1_9GAMM